MKVAFYYHIPICIKDEGIYCLPGFLGVFLDALSKEVDQLIIIAHTHRTEEDYILQSKNITLIDLGRISPAWHRHLYHQKILSNFKKELAGIDAFILRCPSPLAPFFNKYIPKTCKLFYYIVGSYAAGAKEMKPETLREWLIQKYLFLNHRLFLKEIKGKNVFVNSPALKLELSDLCKNIEIIPSTTLTEDDFYKKQDTCTGKILNLLYTGRIDLQKGLIEYILSGAQVSEAGYDVRLHFVGWEDDTDKPIENDLKKLAIKLGIGNKVVFHGKCKVGIELNQFYRMADIYVLPSYHEGFPRTIWEAMANSLPVIATTVGAIPHYLVHEENAILIEPKNIDSLKKAIFNLINNKVLRQRLINNGYKIVQNNTVENRTNEMVRYVQENI